MSKSLDELLDRISVRDYPFVNAVEEFDEDGFGEGVYLKVNPASPEDRANTPDDVFSKHPESDVGKEWKQDLDALCASEAVDRVILWKDGWRVYTNHLENALDHPREIPANRVFEHDPDAADDADITEI